MAGLKISQVWSIVMQLYENNKIEKAKKKKLGFPESYLLVKKNNYRKETAPGNDQRWFFCGVSINAESI
ncbi:MAG: hypothetical protein WBB65_15450 [Anaerolineales bacterium]